MATNHFIYAVVVCVIVANLTSAIDQHLICKSVDNVFSSDAQIQPTRALRGPIQNGRPGKLGPKGDRGEKGQRGIEGIVDYSSVNDTLEKLIASATSKLQDKVARLESEIMNITKVFSRHHPTEQRTDAPPTTGHTVDVCSDGVIFDATCYFMILQSVNRPTGEQMCDEHGGKLAEIESSELQTLVMNYVRRQMTRSVLRPWIGPKYEPPTRTIRLTNGSGVSSSTLRWYPGFPSTSETRTGMRLVTKQDANDSNQGVYNFPENFSTQGVLCEK